MLAHNVRNFCVDAAKKTFIGEISSLPMQVISRPNTGTVQGMFVMNPKTGKIVCFESRGECRDNEGDITHWVLVPAADSLVGNPKLRGWTITLFNT